MIKRVLAGAGAVIAVVCGAVFAAPQAGAAMFSGGDSSYIKATDTVDGTAYLTGASIRVEGTVNGDVYCAGQNITITGTVNGDVICAGSNLSVSGKVAGDVRLAGNSVTVGATIGGSATIFGATVTVDSAAKIAKDATLGGADVLVNGVVGRDLVAGAQTATINGPVGRDIEGEYETLTIGENAVVGGALHYGSNKDAIINGKVNGEVKRSEGAMYQGRRVGAGMTAFASIMTTLAWVLVMALALLLGLPKKMRTVTALAGRQALLVTALGFMSIVALPLLALLLTITIIGIPLAMAVIFAWLLLITISAGVTAIYLGRVIARKKPMPLIAATMLGGLGLILLSLIPLVNILTFVATVSFGTGAVLYAVRGEYEAKPTHKVKLAKA